MALQVRSFAGVGLDVRLDPFDLAKSLNIPVVYLKDIAELSESARISLGSIGGWSGGATPDLGDGSHVIILNDKHSLGRQKATLMEEICHILFGHKPSGISTDRLGGRSYNINIEDEAYAVGAAALVPYHSLRKFLGDRHSIKRIAGHFGVTASLVIYRAKGVQLHGRIT
jgi:hypothetical protein